MPAIQWMVTHANWMPMIGKNPVTSSTSIAAAITQWKMRAHRVCRSIVSGTPPPASSWPPFALASFGSHTAA